MAIRMDKSAKLAYKNKSSFYARSGWLRQNWPDVLISAVLFVAAFFLVYWGTQLLNEVIVEKQAFDIWFQSDIPRVYVNMVNRLSDHSRTRVHPLFSLIAFPPVYLFEQGFDLESITAVRAVISTVASVWLAVLFALLRLLGCRRIDAVLFTLLATVSASAVFWFIVPETYQFGSLSILLALGFAVLTEYRQFSSFWYVGASVLALSITTTNWMVGILVTIVNFSKQKALQITIAAFGLTVLLWGVQKMIFPRAAFFLSIQGEKKFIAPFDPAGPIYAFKAFFVHTMVMPAIALNEVPEVSLRWPLMSVQTSVPGSGTLWGAIAVVLWTALLGLGLWGFFSCRQHTKLRIVLAFSLLGQLLLHVVYGSETFLYSLHFLPLLILLAAFSTFTSARLVALVMVGALVLMMGANNFIQLSKAVDVVNSNAPEQSQPLQMQKVLES